ncbi:GTP cyclohydrolase FolE2 [Salipaludibacillus daqingensis]|uniref:GTP cyclohydrolase FolE2 n=1 Tax=Salipaludibacillus daqingensis TaxID=3041001 RepID=UPI002476645A|nr:GTP cyclohydrolase FolE2 [Salipaludibacillus daqingensis]
MKTNDELPSKTERHVLFGSVPPIKGTKATNKKDMPDLQNTANDFLFPLDRVGIANVTHPIVVRSHYDPALQTTVGTFKMTTSLDQHAKGINMSRLTELLHDYHLEGFEVTEERLIAFTEELALRMEQRSSDIDISFPWFFERESPSLKKIGMMHADCGIHLSYNDQNEIKINVSLTAAVTTLCPCSKEISEYSAHNQRGFVTVEAELAEVLNTKSDWKTLLLEAAETNASSLLYPVLKRPDEKFVTEGAYENPRFVEDLTRLVAADLYENPSFSSFKVMCRNEESIHQHDAFAEVFVDKRKG